MVDDVILFLFAPSLNFNPASVLLSIIRVSAFDVVYLFLFANSLCLDCLFPVSCFLVPCPNLESSICDLLAFFMLTLHRNVGNLLTIFVSTFLSGSLFVVSSGVVAEEEEVR